MGIFDTGIFGLLELNFLARNIIQESLCLNNNTLLRTLPTLL